MNGNQRVYFSDVDCLLAEAAFMQSSQTSLDEPIRDFCVKFLQRGLYDCFSTKNSLKCYLSKSILPDVSTFPERESGRRTDSTRKRIYGRKEPMPQIILLVGSAPYRIVHRPIGICSFEKMSTRHQATPLQQKPMMLLVSVIQKFAKDNGVVCY